MTRQKPPLVRLSDMTPGQFADCFALLSQKTKGKTRDGKPYFTCRFRDAKRVASVMIWGDTPWYEACEKSWQEGQFFKLRATYGDHERYGPQLEIQNVRPTTDTDMADGFQTLDFVERSRHDPAVMFAELREIAEKQLADEPLRKLVLTLLDRHQAALLRLPASQGKFYPFAGGLLEHLLSVTKSCLYLTERYSAYYSELKPPLNRDLVLAGAILHDLGRVAEFDDEVLTPQPTVPGRLLGHLLLGRDLVREAAKEIADLNPELLQLLEHLILTHLTLPEWGSPRLPLIPEVLILHHADDLDAKLEMYVRCLSRDAATGPFTDRDPVLNRQLLKGRSV